MKERVEGFVKLGSLLKDYLSGEQNDTIDKVVKQAFLQNNWFVSEFVKEAFRGVAKMLEREVLNEWLGKYPKSLQEGLTVACVMAGNIPLVGFHDMLCVVLSGHCFVGKMSGKDRLLLPLIKSLLCEINPTFEHKIKLVDNLVGVDYDAVIATGSNNSARYFEQYFGHKPHIIRKGRSSVALLTGNENPKELKTLADDIFMYFGLGCRNVSKVFIPQDFDIRLIFPHFEEYSRLQNHHKWMNNYDYNRSIMLVNRSDFYDTGFSLFVKNKNLLSPISVVNYQEYTDLDEMISWCDSSKDDLQCVVSSLDKRGFVPLGKAQYPSVDDYADGVDTMEFLTTLQK